jgi:hypothetical protein
MSDGTGGAGGDLERVNSDIVGMRVASFIFGDDTNPDSLGERTRGFLYCALFERHDLVRPGFKIQICVVSPFFQGRTQRCL